MWSNSETAMTSVETNTNWGERFGSDVVSSEFAPVTRGTCRCIIERDEIRHEVAASIGIIEIFPD